MIKTVGFLIVDTQANFDTWHNQVKTTLGLPNSTTTDYTKCIANAKSGTTDFYFSVMNDLSVADDPIQTLFTGITQTLYSLQELIDLEYIDNTDPV
jgi:hypothetical protein